MTPERGHSIDHPNLYVPGINATAAGHIARLRADGQNLDAQLVDSMVSTPQAIWIEDGSPGEAQAEVESIMTRCHATTSMPVFVVYNLPFRDGAQYSAGGALNRSAYEAWIDGVAAGIGEGSAIVLLEPDGLGIIPFNTDIHGNEEWCQPMDSMGNPQPGSSADERYAALNYAVDALADLPSVSVYLDGTHSAWLAVGDVADRLVKAGVLRTAGFFLNASNYEPDNQLIKYGTWIAKCIWFTTSPDSPGFGRFADCASQFSPSDPDDFETWSLTDQWYSDNVESLSTYPGASGLKHFVIDTSRNGRGPWVPPAEHPGEEAQIWCNPPDRGLGLRPTLNAEHELVDGFLWIKIPGESDGEGYRWTEGPQDPVRGIVAPAAGDWFQEMALELAHNAEPPLEP